MPVRGPRRQQQHPDLAVLRPPRGAGILPLDSRRPSALFQEAGVIGDQHPARVAQVPGHIIADIVADPVHVPIRAAQQPLHPIRADLARMLGQRPPVLPLQARDQPAQVFPHPGPRLGSPEPACDPLVHPVQLCRDKIHHHALNDPSPDQLSAVAVLSVKPAAGAAAKCSNRIG